MGWVYIDHQELQNLQDKVVQLSSEALDFVQLIRGNTLALDGLPTDPRILELISAERLEPYPRQPMDLVNRLGRVVCARQVSTQQLNVLAVNQTKWRGEIRISPGHPRKEILQELSVFKHLSHKVVLIDRFFNPLHNGKPSIHGETLARLVHSILHHNELKEIYVITDPLPNNEHSSDFERALQKYFKERLGIGVKVKHASSIFPFDHDRYLFTELLRLYSGDSFGYLAQERVAHTKGTLLSYVSHLDPSAQLTTRQILHKVEQLFGYHPFDSKP
jgi:hypothetical protein